MSCILSALTVTSPEDTVKSSPSNVAIPLLVSVASSAAIDILLFVTVVVIPSPPAKVNVSPVLNVSSLPTSAPTVNEPEATALKLNTPEPLTFRNCPSEPAVAGNVKLTSPVRAAGDFNNTE